MQANIPQDIIERVKIWTSGNYDKETQQAVAKLVADNPTELIDAFYTDLEFGTGGLRGIMGVGTNRMNQYTVGMATQGLANYLKISFANLPQIKIAIAYDSRNNSAYFAQIVADVMSANGIKVFLFDALRPTPELSFAIRHLGCQSGIVLTASHNPKEYNGYKAYWNDGAQLTAPHDTNVIAEVRKIKTIDEVHMQGNPALIEIIGEKLDKAYIAMVKSLSLSPELIAKHKNLSIVYTPLHGAGTRLTPMALAELGFANIHTVPEQSIPDGNFPTIHSPNPEEKAALAMAVAQAQEVGADLVMATDPDADRVGVAVKNDKGDFILLNGNQTASILIHYLLLKWKEKNKLTGKEYIIKTIVTSELLKDIADRNGVKSYDVLTGFKYIAQVIRELEGKEQFIGGGEESYGYLIGDAVRDKDAVSACCMIAEIAAWAAEQGKTFYNILQDLYLEYGFYKEDLFSLTKKGKTGLEEIQAMMSNFRQNPPTEIAGSKVTLIKDYEFQVEKNLQNNAQKSITLPKSNVLQFFTEDGSKITVRPSGTEPKIKFYFGVKAPLKSKEEFESTQKTLQNKIDRIIESMNLK